jgi:phage regulator Rha-like protein
MKNARPIKDESGDARNSALIIAPLSLVNIKDVPRIDSRTLAKSLGNTHRPTVALVVKYCDRLQQFGQVLFKKADGGRIQGGGKAERFVLLNEDQAIFLLSLSRNTDRVIELKARLVRAFSDARRNATQRQTEYLPEYHRLHDLIKQLANGSDNERHVHINVNKLVNRVAGIEAGQRHTIPMAMLTAINHVAALAMAGAADHHEGYQRAKCALMELQRLIQGLDAPPQPALIGGATP